jgi:hypothetical protein
MPKFLVAGVYHWFEEMQEYVEQEVFAEDENAAINIVGADQFGLVEVLDDLLHQNSSFDGEVVRVYDIFEDDPDEEENIDRFERAYYADDDDCEYHDDCDSDD